MGTFGVILLVLVVLFAGFGWLGSRYVQFKASTEGRWRDRILGAVSTYEDKLQMLQKETDQAKGRRDGEVEKERMKAFHRYLASISVDSLQDYPGIGPVTVDRLRQAGMNNMQMRPANLQLVPGIGPKKEQVVQEAIQRVVRDAQSRFDAGGCREAQEWTERTRLIDKAIQQQQSDAEQAKGVCRYALKHLDPFLAIARRITFGAYLRKRHIVELTPELLGTPIDKFIPPMPIAMPKPAPIPATPATNPTIRSPEKLTAKPSQTPVVMETQQPKKPSIPTDLFQSEMEAGVRAAAMPVVDHPRLQHLRMVAAFGMAVARADGKIANAERDVVRKCLQQTFGHEAELVRWIDPAMENAEKKPTSLESNLTEMRSFFDEPERQALYRLACDIVDATGKINAKKKMCIEQIAIGWSIASTPITAPKAATPAKLDADPKPKILDRLESQAALEIADGTPITAELIRRQYRLLSERIDPTRLESHGADFVQLAHDKRAKIELAARTLLEQLGEKFEEDKKPEEPKDMRHNPDLDAVFGM